jgi:hypothetical protein
MISRVPGGGRLSFALLALASGIWFCSSLSTVAFGGDLDCPGYHGTGHGFGHKSRGLGTLGYGGDRLYPGNQGFSLSYHLGYGYGDSALGPGIFGGYPFYGGPGYPHGEPPLRRFHHLLPFPYSPGPGYPFSFERVGPLVVDKEVVTIGSDRPDPAYGGDYGWFSGRLPYPEAFFAPYSAAAAATGSSAGAR